MPNASLRIINLFNELQFFVVIADATGFAYIFFTGISEIHVRDFNWRINDVEHMSCWTQIKPRTQNVTARNNNGGVLQTYQYVLSFLFAYPYCLILIYVICFCSIYLFIFVVTQTSTSYSLLYINKTSIAPPPPLTLSGKAYRPPNKQPQKRILEEDAKPPRIRPPKLVSVVLIKNF